MKINHRDEAEVESHPDYILGRRIYNQWVYQTRVKVRSRFMANLRSEESTLYVPRKWRHFN